tara:strand:- start:1534 stop:3090 length:1557 start_codon:yes stop_codon:yes gene_type:complete
MKKINNIVIVGGGTAGWATAINFLNRTQKDFNIKVVSSIEKPIIGVGESTTGMFWSILKLKNGNVKIDIKDFLKKTSSTFKLGIKHTDWYEKGKSFYSPIGDNYYIERSYPDTHYDAYRIYHVARELEFDSNIQSNLMKENKLHLTKDNKDVYEEAWDNGYYPIAFHLDTYKVGQYFKEKALLQENCQYIEGDVKDFEKDENGLVTGLILNDNKKVEGDLFVDCSGFSRVLIDKIEENNFVSYQDELLVNRALPFYVSNDEDKPIRNYTHAWAQKYGWLWEIPTQERLGCGYVYSDKHTTPDKAQEEIEKVLGHKIVPRGDIKFNTGRLQKFWIKNVLSTGLSSAFIEPLEATSIHSTIIQINYFLENFFKKEMPLHLNIMQDRYNKNLTDMWDNIKDFIVYHYITPRKDTDFWIDSSSVDRRSEDLKNKIEMWNYRMPRKVDFTTDKSNHFYSIGNTLWYQIAIGMKLLDPKIARKELEDYYMYDDIKLAYYDIKKRVISDLEKNIFLSTNEYYKSL